MERHTDYRETGILLLPVAAATLCEAGNIAVISGGYAAPGSEATGIVYIGRFEDTVDNSGGVAGEKSVIVRTNLSFKWRNSGADPVVQADVGQICYIEDSVTVSRTNNAAARSAAGIITGVDSGGVWVAKSL